MRAVVGDWLRMGGPNAGSRRWTGQITEIRGADGEPPYLVRLSDGSKRLVVPGSGAVIEHCGSGDEPAGEPAPELMFRVTGGQRRALAIGPAAGAVAAVVLAGAAAAANSGRLAGLAAGVGIAALIALYYSVAYAVAYTRCTAAGLHVRGVAGSRYLPWAQLRDITVRDYGSDPPRLARARYRLSTSRGLRIVIVTADDGRRFWLGAPIDGGQGLGDPEFDSKVRQMEDYWHSVGPRGSASSLR